MTDAVRAVEEQSTGSRKELRLGDLVLAQIVLVVGSSWVGVAGKLGDAHVVYWVLAAALFFAPLAAVVVFEECAERFLPEHGLVLVHVLVAELAQQRSQPLFHELVG